jgi:tRNA pseudouridine38-40 synthase
MRYFIELAFHGQHYHGWQIQENALTVQAIIEQKMAILFKQAIEITGCGRTDTGVHASQYFAHFDFEREFDFKQICYQLNAILPADIVIKRIVPVESNLHARFDAISRTYQYIIQTKPSPFERDLSWTYTPNLAIEAMNEAATLLLKHQNFECFSKVKTQVKTFNCEVTFAKWELKENNKLVFEITANRFLRNMVRAIVGTLIEVGQGKLNKEGFQSILDSKNRSLAGQSVPAQALFLAKINYPPSAGLNQ